MTHRRLWTEEGRERSLDNLVDLLEGYYRCRPNGNGPAPVCKPPTPSLSYSALGYLEFLNRIGQAYATLPLRLLEQLYSRDCAPPVTSKYQPQASSGCGALQLDPQCLSLYVKDGSAFGRFCVRAKPKAEIKLSFTGFKDSGGTPWAEAILFSHDSRGEWSNVVNGDVKRCVDDVGYLMIAVNVDASTLSSKSGLLTGSLHVFLDGSSACLKIELRNPTIT